MRFGVRHADGQRASVALPLIGYPSLPTVYESTLLALKINAA
jgi:hypothetical protein